VILVLGCGLALAQNHHHSSPRNTHRRFRKRSSRQTPIKDLRNQSKTSGNSADVQKDIQTALQKDESLASANISVATTDKNIELSGTVPTQAAKDRVEQIAKEHSGSLTIKNNIKVENDPPGPKQ